MKVLMKDECDLKGDEEGGDEGGVKVVWRWCEGSVKVVWRWCEGGDEGGDEGDGGDDCGDECADEGWD